MERLDNLPKVTQLGFQPKWSESKAQPLHQYALEK